MSESLTHTTDLPSVREDADIVRGLRDGEREAWTVLYDQYSTRVWRYAARLIGSDSAVVADVVQETFLSAAGSARQFDPQRGSLWAWLTGIAHNAVSNHFRQEGRHARGRDIAAGNGRAAPGIPSAETPPDRRLDSQETAEEVRITLRQLPDDYAALLTAKYVDQLSLADMHQLFGGTVEGLRSRLQRARNEFRKRHEQHSRSGVPPTADAGGP